MARGRQGSLSKFKSSDAFGGTFKAAGADNPKHLAYQGKTPSGGQKINIPIGLLGGGGGGGKNIGYAEADYDRQLGLMDKIAEMTTPWSTYGTLGSTVADAEGKKLTQTLSPELQAQYDALLGRAGLTADKVAQMSGSPQELQNYIYNQQQALIQPQQDEARAAMDEQLFARGMLGSTGGAAQRGGLESSIGGQNQQLLANALAQSQGILDAERGRQTQDLSNALTMAGQQNQMMDAGRAYGQGIGVGNVEGVSGASRNIFGQLAARDMGKAKRQKGIWDSLLGDDGLLGKSGLFG